MQVEKPTSDVLSSLGHLISVAARGFMRLSEARLKPLGFGVGYLPALVALENGRASSQRELARVIRIEQSSMAQMMVRMERDGLIERKPDPADRRSSRVVLTETARERLPGACKVLFEGNRDVLRGFSDEEAKQLSSMIGRVIANLDRLGDTERAALATEDAEL